MQHIETLYRDARSLLRQLIAIPSFSGAEDKTAAAISAFLEDRHIPVQRYINNIWATGRHFDPSRPTILLNSHHDTVRPNPQYTKDPFQAVEEGGKLYGLGSNDAGGCLVALIAAFVHFYDSSGMPFNLVLAATAEEEITGKNGIEALLCHDAFLKSLHYPDFHKERDNWAAIVGEPTQMELAVAEKGLMVIDVTVRGKAGHAARNEGENALYKAIKDIEWFRTFAYPKTSEWLGAVKQSVTVIETGNKAHNVTPDACSFTVDIRIPDCYTHEEILDIIRTHISGEARERSVRLRSSRIETTHPLVQAGIALGKKPYGSPTCSDKALMPFPALKCGPGDSARSHTADEFIFLQEMEKGIETYIRLLREAGKLMNPGNTIL